MKLSRALLLHENLYMFCCYGKLCGCGEAITVYVAMMKLRLKAMLA